MCEQGTPAILRLKDGDEVEVDACLQPLLQELNDAGIPTLESCCGHGKEPCAIYFGPGPAGVKFETFGCCGESWIVSLSWQTGKYLEDVIAREAAYYNAEPATRFLSSPQGDAAIRKGLEEAAKAAEEFRRAVCGPGNL